MGTIFFVCFSLLFKPSILYGMQGWVKKIPTTPLPIEPVEALMQPIEEKKKTYLTAEQGAAIKQALEAHLQDNLPFLKPGYSIAQLSQELNIPSYQLSGFINQEYAKNFNELINEYRVRHLISHYPGGEASSQYTLEAIGREVGFNSRAAFIAAVRKVTGKTPSEVLGRRVKNSGLEASA
jgi:AraC-like DNA-binding protein